MRIVFYTSSFYPMVGGLETVVKNWAFELTRLGHEIHVITLGKCNDSDSFPFKVSRGLSNWQLWNVMRKSDIIIQFNVSLKVIVPSILSFRPQIISHHGNNLNITGHWNKYGRIKQFIADHIAALNITCSNYIRTFFKNSITIYSSYQDGLFQLNDKLDRSKEVVFVGRLVSDKGCDVLLKAIQILKVEYLRECSLSIIGDGPEKFPLEELVKEYNLKDCVEFLGIKTEKNLVDEINNHNILVVPSVWKEPFGIVALEGLACGCAVVVSNQGGLPEAVGDYGYLFESGNPRSLAKILNTILANGSNVDGNSLNRHLSQFNVQVTVKKLNDILLRKFKDRISGKKYHLSNSKF